MVNVVMQVIESADTDYEFWVSPTVDCSINLVQRNEDGTLQAPDGKLTRKGMSKLLIENGERQKKEDL